MKLVITDKKVYHHYKDYLDYLEIRGKITRVFAFGIRLDRNDEGPK